MTQSLWFPPCTIDNPGTLLNPYDYANNLEVPRACGGTCYSIGFMLAYNQFSSNASLKNFNPGGPPGTQADSAGKGRSVSSFWKPTAAPTRPRPRGQQRRSLQLLLQRSLQQQQSQHQRFSANVWGYGNTQPSCDFPDRPGCGPDLRPWTRRRPPATQQCASRCLSTPLPLDRSMKRPARSAPWHSTRFRISSSSAIQQSSHPQRWRLTRLSPADPATMTANLRTAINNIMEDGIQVVLIK